jgi:hypothetical protein
MTNTYNPTGTQTDTKTIQASDIKSLIQRQGKATINDKEVTLKSPAASDPKLQEIVKDPSFSVKPVGTTSANGEREFELSANGKTVKIKIDCKSCH